MQRFDLHVNSSFIFIFCTDIYKQKITTLSSSSTTILLKQKYTYIFYFSDFVYRLLSKLETRLGKNGAQEIQQHPFFKGIDWTNLRKSKK